jgi:hypothetical protein
MSIIPLDLQRRHEQRWAARFARPVPPVASKQELEGKISSLPPPTEGKKKTRRIEPTGLTPVPAGRSLKPNRAARHEARNEACKAVS